MSDTSYPVSPAPMGGVHRPERFSMPKSSAGWWACGLTALIFPVAWALITHAIPWALLDTAFAPVLLVTLIDAAAVTGLVAVRSKNERSLLVILALVVAIPLAVFGSMMMVLEVMFPHYASFGGVESVLE